ncbi:DUF6445 family protein [Colwellia sp. RE-S-Sl-9]
MNEINLKAKPSHFFIGDENTPIFILDDILLDTSAAIIEAQSANYIQQKNVDGTYYPGVRADVGGDYGMTILKAIQSIFYSFYQVPKNLTLIPKSGQYSLLTQSERELDLLQCLPHYDNKNQYSFAVLHYLNPGEFGGTGFYRHRPTGYENITQRRKSSYISAAQKYIDNNGLPTQKYFTHSDEHYELLKKVDYKANRLLIYPASVLHSIFIENPEHDVNDDPATGRLTANFFIDFK